MSLSLEEALQGVELTPGQTHRCFVNGQWVEVRVAGLEPFSEPPTESAPRVPFRPSAKAARVTPMKPFFSHVPEDSAEGGE